MFWGIKRKSDGEWLDSRPGNHDHQSVLRDVVANEGGTAADYEVVFELGVRPTIPAEVARDAADAAYAAREALIQAKMRQQAIDALIAEGKL